jgi:thymidylate kinase
MMSSLSSSVIEPIRAGMDATLLSQQDQRSTNTMVPLIAIVGSDGSGKSTVGELLLAWLQESRPTELCHLGKQTGNIGRAIAKWPILGSKLDKAIAAKAGKAQDSKGPSTLTALIIYLFSMRRVRRFRRMLAIRRKGVTVLADRFPQIEVPGPMDGLGLAKAAEGGALARALARRERRHYEWMTGYRPTLVLRLTVDLATAFARKPDHRYASLQTKIDHVARLSFGGAPIVDIDATLPLDEVIRQAKQAITDALSRPAEAP